MANLIKLEFVALHSSGKNYLSWVLDAEIHLDAIGLGDTIKDKNKASKQNCAKAMIFLRHHLDEILKIEYLTVKDPLVLWKSLKERYDHLKMVIHPKARYDWMHLMLQDYNFIHEYNSAMFRITSLLKLCGETINDIDMMEKTFSTFNASNVLLQQQYPEKDFKKYSELISHLLVAEVNEVYTHHARHGKGRGHGRGRGCDSGHNFFFVPGVNHSSKKSHHQKEKRKDEKHEAVKVGCFRCGAKGHHRRDCHTPKHLVELFQASLKKKEKNPETNFISEIMLTSHNWM